MSQPFDPREHWNPPPAAPTPATGQPGLAAGPVPGAVGGRRAGAPRQFDPASGQVLPNGVPLASVARRIGGFFLEFALLVLTLFLGWLVWSLIVWSRGQTPAKQVLKMRCYRPQTGLVASWGYMALRQIVGTWVEGLLPVVLPIVSAIMMVTSRDHRAIHDHVAGTVVLYDPADALAES